MRGVAGERKEAPVTAPLFLATKQCVRQMCFDKDEIYFTTHLARDVVSMSSIVRFNLLTR